MVVESLKLVNFRNFESFEVEFSSRRTLILGPNGAGKSNLLEAIYLLASGSSNKAEREAETIRLGTDFAKAKAVLKDAKEKINLDLSLSLSESDRVTKVGKINGVKKSLRAFAGTFRAVEFSPRDIELVTGSPEGRRRYLNSVLNQASFEYRASLLSYERARQQKNSLLSQMREGEVGRGNLNLWNGELVRFGQVVSQSRSAYLKYLTARLTDVQITYHPSSLSLERLAEFADREIAAGVSLIGPHRDDFRFEASLEAGTGVALGKDLSDYGSRGQQRMAVFKTKMAELNYFRHQLKTEPLLLLDDIFSELDKEHRQEIASLISPAQRGGSQAIITATNAENLKDYLGDAKVIKL